MKTGLPLLLAALALIGAWWMASGGWSQPAPGAAGERVAYLIRFGVDQVKDVDWSGRISPKPLRLAGWQFDSRDDAGAEGWRCATRSENYWDTPYERSMKGTSRRDKITAKGLVVAYRAGETAPIEISTAQGKFSFTAGDAWWTTPRRFLDGRVEVSAAPSPSHLTEGPDADDFPTLLEARDGTLWLTWQAYSIDGDQLFVQRSRAGGEWSLPEAVAPSGGDYFRTALGEDASGGIWVVWSAQVAGDFDLYGRRWDGKGWSNLERLTRTPGPDIYHVLARDSSGRLHLAWQSARNGNFDIYLRSYEGKEWTPERPVSDSPANDWEPALAAAPDGSLAVLWDTYASGSYDVVSRRLRGGTLASLVPIASSGAFEARVSARYDRQGRLWMAWEEGDWNWGKDYGSGIIENGRGLLVRRHVRVGVLAGGKLLEPAGSLAEAVPADLRQVFQSPDLVFDGNGNPWVFFRYRVNVPQGDGKRRSSRTMWRAAAAAYRAGRWTPAVEFAEGFGRIDSPLSAVAARDGRLHAVWVSDGREWPYAVPEMQDLIYSRIPAAPPPGEPALNAFRPGAENLAASHPREPDNVARVRAYRVKLGAKEYRIVRGDVHRHTDISWDGNRDGSLEDSYRYALDAAALDYQGVCDHYAGNMNPYSWWRIQKAADLFTIPGRFAPLYSYERSLPFPNGHRNVLFARRGRPVLKASEAEEEGKEGAAKLYEYLRRFGGLTTAHTTATGAGTDWRDSDADVEPVVEIYQGYRRNYEGPGTPRAPENDRQERFAAGYVWNAWAKGIRLGVQSSSDHVSTHISYSSFYVDSVDREAILAAAKARRSFAATDNLIVDFRMGDHFMGEMVTAAAPLPIRAHLRGAGPIDRVELIKDNRVIYSAPGAGEELSFTFTDRDAGPGESYYYVRAQQKDGQLAWSSPIWVTYR